MTAEKTGGRLAGKGSERGKARMRRAATCKGRAEGDVTTDNALDASATMSGGGQAPRLAKEERQ